MNFLLLIVIIYHSIINIKFLKQEGTSEDDSDDQISGKDSLVNQSDPDSDKNSVKVNSLK